MFALACRARGRVFRERPEFRVDSLFARENGAALFSRGRRQPLLLHLHCGFIILWGEGGGEEVGRARVVLGCNLGAPAEFSGDMGESWLVEFGSRGF